MSYRFNLNDRFRSTGYYYVGTVNEYEEEIYQIYWYKDGYSFQANIPKELINKSAFDSQVMLADKNNDNIWNSEINVKTIEYTLNDISQSQ